MITPTLLWLRQDLRLADHAALLASIDRGGAVLPVFVWAPEEEGEWSPGAASRWWLHHSLAALDAGLRARGSRLLLRRGPSLTALRELAREAGAGAVHWSRRYEPSSIARDADVKKSLRADGLIAESFASALLVEPWEIKTAAGTPYKVFTPFWRTLVSGASPLAPEPAPEHVPAPSRWPKSIPLGDLSLLPSVAWDAGLADAWTPGEDGALELLDEFVDEAASAYAEERDRPDRRSTSHLGPHLHFGEISPRQAWHARLAGHAGLTGRSRGASSSDSWLRQIVWREFAAHLLFHFPETASRPLRPEYERFPWHSDAVALRAWSAGRTGYPIVDAGMRELWATGWMHGRVRMVVASFLVKDLLIPWQDGARWFWDTLVDADLANNTFGWQWTAGCGADAAPYFRIFNPVSQGKKFDPEGTYVRRWIPEIAGLATDRIHAPWLGSPAELARAGVELGVTYPAPIVDHAEARAQALEALSTIRAAR